MLIDDPTEPLGELEIEETKNELPEKYRSKSLDEVVRMHQEAERLIGKQAQEVGEVRKLADELIKQNLSGRSQPIKEEEPEVDFFENPQKAVQATIDRHPDVLAARQAGVDFRRMQIQQKLVQDHPDYSQVVNDPEFHNWVKSSPVRLGLYAKADAEFDYDSANELLSTFKQLRGVKAKQSDQANDAIRTKSMKAAQVDIGGSGESSKRVYRRADLIRLKMTDPQRYETLSDEIMQAYSEGRVR
jgi:hypothetical protein